ncbi:MAG TPA: acyltransferase family protein [Phycisphaerae bacterium]|nr:acyltransferase family protein [Phycisphaerae bacterium]
MSQASAVASRNFRFAKALAIVLVFSGHFGTGIPGFWMLVSIGLFVFAFSSAYFTSAKYHEDLDLRAFWKSKLLRLVPSLAMINLFLLGLFLVQRRPGIWNWQTPVSILGLSGFCTWFGIKDQTPFGLGVWFLTLLLVFYAAYPVVRRAARSRLALHTLTWVGLVAAGLLDWYVPMGHALWFTAWAFIFGIFAQRTALALRPLACGIGAFSLAATLFAVNPILGLKVLNFPLLVGMSGCTVLFLLRARVPALALRPLDYVAPMTLEIYLLHPYLLLHPAGYPATDYLLSLACVLGVAWLLHRAASLLTRRGLHVAGTPRA